jgi:segregation and condensation protein B
MSVIANHIQAMIFASEQPLDFEDIKECLTKLTGLEIVDSELEAVLNMLIEKYTSDEFPFEIVKTGGGYQMLTKKPFHISVAGLLEYKSPKRLSTAALETLAIIAYKQPITKVEVEQIRGVNCDYSVQKLLEKDLIIISGRSEMVGKPILYSVSKNFMDYFGINSMDELPRLKELTHPVESEVGIHAES